MDWRGCGEGVELYHAAVQLCVCMQEDRLEGPWMMYSGLREREENIVFFPYER